MLTKHYLIISREKCTLIVRVYLISQFSLTFNSKTDDFNNAEDIKLNCQ